MTITYENIKDNKRSESTAPVKQWVAHGQAEIDIFNTCPKRVEWTMQGQKATAELQSPHGACYGGKYTIKVGSDRREISRVDFVKGMAKMPADAVVTAFEPKDIYWV